MQKAFKQAFGLLKIMFLWHIFGSMNNKTLCSLLFVFLTALTVNMAHVVLEHERDVCEICLHIQTNDEMDVAAESDLSVIEQPHQTTFCSPSLIHDSHTESLDSIRAPPLFA